MTLYFEVLDSKDKRPGTEQNIIEGSEKPPSIPGFSGIIVILAALGFLIEGLPDGVSLFGSIVACCFDMFPGPNKGSLSKGMPLDEFLADGRQGNGIFPIPLPLFCGLGFPEELFCSPSGVIICFVIDPSGF